MLPQRGKTMLNRWWSERKANATCGKTIYMPSGFGDATLLQEAKVRHLRSRSSRGRKCRWLRSLYAHSTSG